MKYRAYLCTKDHFFNGKDVMRGMMLYRDPEEPDPTPEERWKRVHVADLKDLTHHGGDWKDQSVCGWDYPNAL